MENNNTLHASHAPLSITLTAAHLCSLMHCTLFYIPPFSRAMAPLALFSLIACLLCRSTMVLASYAFCITYCMLLVMLHLPLPSCHLRQPALPAFPCVCHVPLLPSLPPLLTRLFSPLSHLFLASSAPATATRLLPTRLLLSASPSPHAARTLCTLLTAPASPPPLTLRAVTSSLTSPAPRALFHALACCRISLNLSTVAPLALIAYAPPLPVHPSAFLHFQLLTS